MIAQFERFSITMTKAEALSMFHHGRCDDDVEHYVTKPKFEKQFAKIGKDPMAKELKDIGGWSEEELSDHEQNKRRILWLAAGSVVEGMAQKVKR